jgi:large subunit ribosomal protein L17
MRHRRRGRKLGRTQSHKKALLRNLANQVIEHTEIRTTLAKAREARRTVERLITYAKKGTLHHRRLAFAFLQNKETVTMLFDEIADSYSDRQGGYTRIYKLGKRSGDAADMSILQLVGFEKLASGKSKAQKKKVKAKPVSDEAAAKKDKKEKAAAPAAEEVETIQEAEVIEEEKPDVNKEAVKEEITPKAEEPVAEEPSEPQEDARPAAEEPQAGEEAAPETSEIGEAPEAEEAEKVKDEAQEEVEKETAEEKAEEKSDKMMDEEKEKKD